MMDERAREIARNYAGVCEEIATAAREAGRDPAGVKVVAVTKTWPPAVVVAAYEAGIRHIGENRPEELAEKHAEVEAILGPESGLVWHLIGPLQSRKTGLAAAHADFFHALDRLKIAHRLSRELADSDRTLPVLLEVNVSGEASKHGFAATRWEEDAAQRESLLQAARAVASLPALEVRGLMTMAPWEAPPDEIRAVFARTRALAAWLAGQVPQASWSQLSMGMTDDFALAVVEGATHVRIGRAIFGERRV
jgi:PLP dependent protein